MMRVLRMEFIALHVISESVRNCVCDGVTVLMEHHHRSCMGLGITMGSYYVVEHRLKDIVLT